MNYAFLLFFLWVIVINAIGFNVMYKDKLSAESGGWRVKESHLFLIAALLGAVSIYLSMYGLRHKLRKYYFKYGMIALIMENVIVSLAFFLVVINYF